RRHHMSATTTSFGLSAIGQIAIATRDLDRAVAFYRDVLGCACLAPAGAGAPPRRTAPAVRAWAAGPEGKTHGHTRCARVKQRVLRTGEPLDGVGERWQSIAGRPSR